MRIALCIIASGLLNSCSHVDTTNHSDVSTSKIASPEIDTELWFSVTENCEEHPIGHYWNCRGKSSGLRVSSPATSELRSLAQVPWKARLPHYFLCESSHSSLELSVGDEVFNLGMIDKPQYLPFSMTAADQLKLEFTIPEDRIVTERCEIRVDDAFATYNPSVLKLVVREQLNLFEHYARTFSGLNRAATLRAQWRILQDLPERLTQSRRSIEILVASSDIDDQAKGLLETQSFEFEILTEQIRSALPEVDVCDDEFDRVLCLRAIVNMKKHLEPQLEDIGGEIANIRTTLIAESERIASYSRDLSEDLAEVMELISGGLDADR